MSTASFDVSNVSDVSGAHRTSGPAPYRDEDFPGCESFHLPAGELDHYEDRLEFWDGATETAWKVCEPTSIQHEQPSRRLVRMAERVASLRGSAIECFGSGDLVRLDATGRRRWLMQADEVLYLHPDRVRLQGPAIDVDADPLPEVVLEVDHTTDVRRRKLGIYKESGFPEIWVLVPWESSVRRPGLAIHVRHGEGYREERTSRAFPGWRAEEIHRALTEAPMSEVAWRALERTALSMGAREGTAPEDDPLMRSQNARARMKGHAQGHQEGLVQGREQGIEQGRKQGLAHERALLRRMAASRFGADTAERLEEVLAGVADPERLAEAGEWLVRCETGDELLARVHPARPESGPGKHSSTRRTSSATDRRHP